jgi:acetyl-CoA carboxylase biotin carboxyl carrier protein
VGTEIEAQVAGRIVRIERRAGDEVAAEDVILVLESMKMDIPVVAPKAGRIGEIRVAEGQHVAEGQLLARLD